MEQCKYKYKRQGIQIRMNVVIHRAVQIQIQKAGYPDQNECGDSDHGIYLS